MTEQWLPVVGYEGLYEISDHGRVRSLQRVVMRSNGAPQTVRGKILTPILKRPDQDHVTVCLCREGEEHTRQIHRLVLEAFVGPCPPGKEALHEDDIGDHNYLGNLRWGTRSENMDDAIRNGRNRNANKTHCPQGHEYTPENTYTSLYNGKVRRNCRACAIARSRAVRAPC